MKIFNALAPLLAVFFLICLVNTSATSAALGNDKDVPELHAARATSAHHLRSQQFPLGNMADLLYVNGTVPPSVQDPVRESLTKI